MFFFVCAYIQHGFAEVLSGGKMTPLLTRVELCVHTAWLIKADNPFEMEI